ncbi:OLC1v1000444C1 [Oldenlandia corymbosa var. corymbosa]|uniref:OLC1v1000444C1 n=1 Tax=Oldenlandia corymbosa var. corymbosa TaxID=529605 RepID=A0AAV1D5W3_OLDCO|nr:OLC1v1000444C1 [Oldenlandia corymbosa var. corymbosa]
MNIEVRVFLPGVNNLTAVLRRPIAPLIPTLKSECVLPRRQQRSTKASEEAVLRDLSWLGLTWDEGPEIEGSFGPYRQSERNALYMEYADKLLQSGQVYRCFCSSDEIDKMKEFAKVHHLPPVYTGKWANATDQKVEKELSKGTPYTYRFRVPKEGSLQINDLIRGQVEWKFDTLGDFVIMRSNGQPVYNSVSPLMMLPWLSLMQALIYKALGFPMPKFAHVSLILAPDKSKLSKRHGATSVGQFREMGFLPRAMVNYLALLGWGDCTTNEFFTLEELVEKFRIDRVNKSGAVFDYSKLSWMNGRYLRLLPPAEMVQLIGDHWKSRGFVTGPTGSFMVEGILQLQKDGIDLLEDGDKALLDLISYPLHVTLATPECKPVIEDDSLSEVAATFLAAYDNGELFAALEEGQTGWQKWVKSFGETLNRKGKAVFMPQAAVDRQAPWS